MANGEPRISVSIETLRTEIRLANAELELRLRAYIAAELEKKAEASRVSQLEQELATLTRQVVMRDGPLIKTIDDFEREQERFRSGEFTPAQQNTIKGMIGAKIAERTSAGWTQRQRMIAVLGVGFWLCSIALSAASLLLK